MMPDVVTLPESENLRHCRRSLPAQTLQRFTPRRKLLQFCCIHLLSLGQPAQIRSHAPRYATHLIEAAPTAYDSDIDGHERLEDTTVYLQLSRVTFMPLSTRWNRSRSPQ